MVVGACHSIACGTKRLEVRVDSKMVVFFENANSTSEIFLLQVCRWIRPTVFERKIPKVEMRFEVALAFVFSPQ